MRRTYYFEYIVDDDHFYFKAETGTADIKQTTYITISITKLKQSEIRTGYKFAKYYGWHNMTVPEMVKDIDQKLASIRNTAW